MRGGVPLLDHAFDHLRQHVGRPFGHFRRHDGVVGRFRAAPLGGAVVVLVHVHTILGRRIVVCVIVCAPAGRVTAGRAVTVRRTGLL